MDTERPHDIRQWDELTEAERQRYIPIPPDQEEKVKAMTEEERHDWSFRMKTKLDELARLRERVKG